MNIYSCKGCGLEKEASLFPKDHRNKNGLNTRCKLCENHRRKERNHSRHIPGFTTDQYEKLLEEQQGVCAICQQSETVSNRRLAVDHCHTTNKVRGLLCTRCNTTLGRFNDDPELFIRAASYLQPTKAASFS